MCHEPMRAHEFLWNDNPILRVVLEYFIVWDFWGWWRKDLLARPVLHHPNLD
jgi:hypothetical protein